MTKETTTILVAVLNNYAKNKHLFDDEHQAFALLTNYNLTGFESDNENLTAYYQFMDWLIEYGEISSYPIVLELIMSKDNILPDKISLNVMTEFNKDHDNETDLYISLIRQNIECQKKVIALYSQDENNDLFNTENIQQYLRASNEIACKLVVKVAAYLEALSEELYAEFFDYFDKSFYKLFGAPFSSVEALYHLL